MLARAARHSLKDLPADVGIARQVLLQARILRDPPAHARGRTVRWPELRRDLRRLAQVGVRLPACPALRTSPSRADEPSESGRPARSHARPKAPTLEDACYALAEVASPEPTPEARASH